MIPANVLGLSDMVRYSEFPRTLLNLVQPAIDCNWYLEVQAENNYQLKKYRSMQPSASAAVCPMVFPKMLELL